MEKKLYKTRKNKKLCGVCGGFSEYLNIDPTIIRLLFAFFTFFSFGTGLFLYIIAALIMDYSPDNEKNIFY